VIDTGRDERHTGNAMHDTAQLFAHGEDFGQPGVGELEREAGEDENDEADEQDEMLPALVGCHADHERILDSALRDCFAAPDNGVVQEHDSDHQDNERDVDPADPAHDPGADVV